MFFLFRGVLDLFWCYFWRLVEDNNKGNMKEAYGRDQAITQQAMDSLEQVVRRFPDSRYAQDARLKIDMTRDHLAGREMDVGRWYLRRNYHLAAINRFRNVISDYQTTSHTPEALHRLAEAYVAMGIDEEARQVAARSV